MLITLAPELTGLKLRPGKIWQLVSALSTEHKHGYQPDRHFYKTRDTPNSLPTVQLPKNVPGIAVMSIDRIFMSIDTMPNDVITSLYAYLT